MNVFRRSTTHPQLSRREIFTGSVESAPYVDERLGRALRLGLVRFHAGARTRWHTHSFEQGLVITEGKGIVATEEAEHLVEAGDVVFVPAGEKHWHGGTEATAMAHVSITAPGETTVLEAVDSIRTRA